MARAHNLAKLRESQSAPADAGVKDVATNGIDAEDTDVQQGATVPVVVESDVPSTPWGTDSVAARKKWEPRSSGPSRAALSSSKPAEITEATTIAAVNTTVASVVDKVAATKVDFATPVVSSLRQRPISAVSQAVTTAVTTAAQSVAPSAATLSPVRTILNLLGLAGIPSTVNGPTAPLPLPRLLELIFVAVRKQIGSTLFNQPPIATPTTSESNVATGVITGKVNPSDADNETSDLTVAVVTRPTKGSLDIDEAGNFTYTPDPTLAHAAGGVTDSFTVVVSDENGPFHLHGVGSDAGVHTSSMYTVNLVVAQTDTKPVVAVVASDPDVAGNRTVTVTSYDADADEVSVTPTVTGPGSLGTPTTTLSSDSRTTTTVYAFTPDSAAVHAAGKDGTAVIAVSVDDGHTGVTVADSVSVTVPFRDAAPVINSVKVGDAATDGSRTITVTATDPDGDLPTFTVDGVDSGTVDKPVVQRSDSSPVVTATFLYQPDATYVAGHPNSVDGFTVSATDEYGLVATDSTASIAIPGPPPAPQTQPPKLASPTVSAPDANGKVTISASASDDGDFPSITITGGSETFSPSVGTAFTNGTVSGASVQGSYTPSVARRLEAAASPVKLYDELTVTATDNDGADTKTVLVEVVPLVDKPPTVDSVSFTGLGADGTQSIKVTASDPDGDTPTISIAGIDTGTLGVPVVEKSATNVVTATYVYTPPTIKGGGIGGLGTVDDFTVKATDSQGLSTTKDVSLTVGGVAGLPVISTPVQVSPPDPVDGHVVITVNVRDEGDDVPVITVLGSGGSPVGVSNTVQMRDGMHTTWTASYTPSAAVRAAANADGLTVEIITVVATDNEGAVSTTAQVSVAPPVKLADSSATAELS